MIKERDLAQELSFGKIFKKTIFYKTPLMAASGKL